MTRVRLWLLGQRNDAARSHNDLFVLASAPLRRPTYPYMTVRFLREIYIMKVFHIKMGLSKLQRLLSNTTTQRDLVLMPSQAREDLSTKSTPVLVN